EPGLRHQDRRYARAAVGSGVVRRRHQLPRDLGHHTRGSRRDLPGPAARRAGRVDGVGSPEGVRRILGAGTVRPSRGGEGGQPGGDGLARPAWRGRATPSVLRIRRYRAHGRPVRVGVRGPGPVRARPGQYRPGLRGHSERRRGRVPSRRRRAGTGAAARWPASACRHQRRGLPGPQTRRSRTLITGSFLQEPPVSPVARGSTGGVLGMLAGVNPVRLLRRIAVTVAGTVILAVGLVLLVAPGPGLVVIALALAVFAIEYQWARRNLAAVQERARSAALKAAASRVATASAVLFGIGAIGLGVVLIFTDLLPLSGVGTGVGAAVGGLTVLLTVAYGVREMRNAKKAGESEDAE